jgi:hypothetical protein
MIKFEPKPKKTIQYFDGTAALDQNYTFTIVKSINGSQKYSVQDIAPEPTSDDIRAFIVKTIENCAAKEGVGVTNINTEQ